MFRLVLGIGIGYVLGSRAGRERYEQIKRWSSSCRRPPRGAGCGRVRPGQGLRGVLQGPVTRLAGTTYPDSDGPTSRKPRYSSISPRLFFGRLTSTPPINASPLIRTTGPRVLPAPARCPRTHP